MSISIRRTIPWVAAVLTAGAVSLLAPAKAEAWWVRGGCCWGGIVVAPPLFVAPPVYAPPPPVAYAPAPYYYAPRRYWVPGYYRGPYYVPGHWS